MVLRFSAWHLALALLKTVVARVVGGVVFRRCGAKRGTHARCACAKWRKRARCASSAASATVRVDERLAASQTLLSSTSHDTLAISQTSKSTQAYTNGPCSLCPAHSLVMKLMNSLVHSWMASFASLAILALAGSTFFMMRLMLATGSRRSCSRPLPPASSPASAISRQQLRGGSLCLVDRSSLLIVSCMVLYGSADDA